MRINRDHPKVAQLIADADTPLPRRAFTIRETAAMLGVHYATVRNAIVRGDLGAIRDMGHRFLVPADELTRFLAAHCTYNPKPGRKGRKPQAKEASV